MAEADPLRPVDAWLATAIAALEPAARRTLLNSIARAVRKANQARITKQVGPDGTPWTPRKKDRDGRVRKKAKMMLGLRQARRMAITVTDGDATIGYAGILARIAAVHEFGEVDAVVPGDPAGPKVKYAARPMLGLAVEDIAFIRRAVLEAMEGK